MTITSDATLGGRRYRCETLSLPARGKDQDACRRHDGFVAVADGATPLGNQTSAAVRKFTDAVLDALEAQNDRPAVQMARLAITATAGLAREYDPPLSCTAAIARTEARDTAYGIARTAAPRIELAILGDCVAVVADEHGRCRTIRDPRLNRLDAEVIARLKALLDAEASFNKAKRSILHDLRTNRTGMNRRGSYWSFSCEPAASRHIIHRIRSPQEAAAILLCTDGFARLADVFGSPGGPAGLLRRARREGGLEAMGRQLRALERDRYSLARYPRFSRFDDATAILLTGC